MKHLFGGVGLLCAAVNAFSQSPSISHITVNAVSHASVNIQFRNNIPSWVQLRYGLSSGNYTYTSASYQSYVNPVDSNYVDASISLGGLAPGTTYYVLPTARPNPDDDNGICLTPACGAVEQVFTTAALPATHPAVPAQPSAWVPTEPDTSAYTIVSMRVNSGNGECVAAGNVAQQARWSGTVFAGDNISTILQKISYGTVIEFPQGAVCNVFQTESGFHSGYMLPALPVDSNAAGDINSPAHRWIMFRTKSLNAGDFPPPGVRTGPQFAARLAKLVAQNPGMPTDGSAPGRGTQNFNGQLFDCYHQGCHHFWFENLEWTHLADSTIYPAGLVDPPAFVPYIRLIPNDTDITTPGTTPNYNVVDRIYAHGQPWPAREVGIFSPGGNHWAITNSYGQANMWFPGVFPAQNPVIAGSVITVNASTYQINAFDGHPIGMTGPATAAFTVPAGYAGSFYAWIDAGGLTIDYQGASGVQLSCSGCTAVAEANPSRNSVPATSMYFFNGHFSNGTAVLDASTPWNTTPTALTSFRPMGIYHWPGNFGYVDNNFISAIGQTVYNDTDGSRTDQTWTHNYFYFPRSKMKNSGQWDGYGYSFRNIFETKQALRWRLEGNIFDGSASYQNPGNVMYIAGSYAGPFSTGTQDIAIRNSIFKHLSSGFQCAGGGAQLPPDSPTASRIEVSNNLWLDLNRDLYNNGGGGLFSGPFSNYPGCEDLSIHHNTVDLTLGVGPALLLTGAAANGASVMGEGLNFSNNLVHLSLNALDPVATVCGQNLASHPAYPAALCSLTVPGASFGQLLDSAYIHAGVTITPSWNFSHNVVIGAMTTRGRSSWTDIDQTTLNSVAGRFPPGNVFPTGTTMDARRQAVQWNPVTYRVSSSPWDPGDVGANVDALYSAAGIVQKIKVNTAAAAVQFTYLAPDSRACYADVSSDGVTWKRGRDSGGYTSRTLVISGLTALTSYQYRIMCYFDQAAQFEFLSDQITSGSFRTGSSGPRAVTLAFQLPAGAASATVTLTPPGGGTPVVQTCGSSPCVLAVAPGEYDRSIVYTTGGGAAVGAPDQGALQIN